MPSQPAAHLYDVFEGLLRSVLPDDCRIFQANMPLQLMDALTRESARLCTYLVFQDRIRMNSSGATPVHDVTVEINLYAGTIDDVDTMSRAVSDLFVGKEVTDSGWCFVLYPAQTGKRDIWEPRIQVKREWIQFRGLAIEPEE